MSGLELQEEMYKRRIRLATIFLTGHADVPMAVRALKRGAFDFIEKPVDAHRLLLSICNALRITADQEAAAAMRSDKAADPSSSRCQLLEKLSERERQVLSLVLNGFQSRAIAQELSLSLKTVEFHRARIRDKLGVKSFMELVRLFSLP